MLRNFLSVAELGSFTLASEKLALSQSVISRSVKQLEETVGATLLERTTRSVKLTAAGSAFLLDTRSVLERIRTASDRARQIGLGDTVKLRVGVDLSVNTSPLVEGLPRFRKQWPMIDVELVVSSTPLADSLRAGQIDVAAMRLEQISEGLDWRVAARDKAFNVGDFTQVQRIDIAQRLKVSVSRPAPRKRWTRVVVTVTNPLNKAVAGATVRVSGAGIRAKRGRTNGRGKVTFRLRPRKKGRLLFSATKPGYAAGALSMRVR